MERRKFIGSAGLAGILATGMAPAVQAGQAIRWRLVSRFPRSMDIAYDGMHFLARQVKEMSNGKFEIAIQAADELTGNSSVLESVQRGNIECGHTSANYYVAKDETFAFDTSIPFGLNARQMNAWMEYGGGLILLREFYKSHGLVNFPLGNTGAQMGGWYRKPVRSLGDYKGLRMRILGLGGRVVEHLGVIPSSQSSGETFNALQQGSLDAAEWGSPHDDLKLGLHDVCPYYAYPGWWKGSSQFSLYVNFRAHEALTDENQAILEVAAAATHLAIQAQYDAKNTFALEQLVATGTVLLPLPAAIFDAAKRASTELYAELAVKNPHWRKIHASYEAFQRDKIWHWGYAETGYDAYIHAQQMKTRAEKRRKKVAPPGRGRR